MSHECPANGCTRAVTPAMLMCRPHWYMVPRPLRNALWDAWNHGLGAGTPAHRAAMKAAIEAVNKKLAEPPPPKPSLADVLKSIVGGCIDHEHEQIGHCVYCKPCGRRLYQGTVWTEDERAGVREVIASQQ